MLLDATGWVNVVGRMPSSAAAMLQGCAARTVALLDSFLPPETKFEKVFLARAYFGMHFDHHFRVSVSPPGGEPGRAFGGDVPLWTDQERLVEHVARLALGKRVTSAHCGARRLRPQALRKSDKAEKLTPREPQLSSEDEAIDLFLAANSELAHSQVDVGPRNTEKDLCRNFRDFWGDLAQLRQFKDTSIAEAVVWDFEGSRAPRALMQRSLRHALCRNLRPAEARVSTREHHLDFLLGAKGHAEDKAAAIRAFDKLSRILRSLDSLPLRVESLQAAWLLL